MENINLFLLRLILASVLLGVFTAGKAKETQSHIAHKSKPTSVVAAHKRHDFYLKPKLESPKHLTKNKRRKEKKIAKKSKREAYRNYGKSWSAKSSNFGYGEYSNDLPLYLVFNRKVGAYYPFYKYPKENHIRRNSNLRRVPLQ